MGASDINLDGAEISIIKTLGLSGSASDGETLMEKVPHLEMAELQDILKTLVAIGYVDADRSSWSSKREFETTHFHVNSGYAKELREALSPQQPQVKSKRVRRE